MLLELFTEASGNPKVVEEKKIWLLRNKQTSNWRTTKATAAACYALLMSGTDLLTSNDASPAITLGGQPLAELKPTSKQRQEPVTSEQVSPMSLLNTP